MADLGPLYFYTFDSSNGKHWCISPLFSLETRKNPQGPGGFGRCFGRSEVGRNPYFELLSFIIVSTIEAGCSELGMS
jgi:hypothetical protein